MIDALGEPVQIPLWLLLSLAGYHRVIEFGQRAVQQRRGRRDRARRKAARGGRR